MNYSRLSLFFLSAVLLFTLPACQKSKSESTEAAEAFCIPDSLMNNITLDTVKSESVMSDLKLSGKITFNENNVVKVFPLVGGHVSEVKVSLGDYVEKGQL